MSYSTEPIVIPTVSISPNWLCVYGQLQGSYFRKKAISNPFNVPVFKSPKSQLSDKARIRLRRTISWLVKISQTKTIFDIDTNRKFKSRVQFITLTIPGKQLHTAHQIKKGMLHPFLSKMSERHGMRNYVWVMEHHKSGTIHFHIATDSFIPWYIIRRRWNNRLQQFGYIARWRSKMRSMTCQQYIQQHMERNKSSREQAFKSYQAGCRSDWKDPNSTDIHSVSKVKNLAAYLVKYMSKGSRCKAVEVVEGETIEAQEGKIWASSRELGKIKTGSIEISGDIQEELIKLQGASGVKVVQEEHFKLLIVDLDRVVQGCEVLGKRVKDWINKISTSIAIKAQVIEFHSQTAQLKP